MTVAQVRLIEVFWTRSEVRDAIKTALAEEVQDKIRAMRVAVSQANLTEAARLEGMAKALEGLPAMFDRITGVKST